MCQPLFENIYFFRLKHTLKPAPSDYTAIHHHSLPPPAMSSYDGAYQFSLFQYMARTQSPDHQLQRDEILECAATEFAKSSYPGTSMSTLARACGTSKARLYHYYPSKEAILFDLLDRYTQALIQIAEKHDSLPELISAFLTEYKHSRTRHIALLHDIKFLEEPQRTVIVDAQRRLVDLFANSIQKSYPGIASMQNRSAITMLLFGMINWTFTWLKSGQEADMLSYADFAKMVTTIFMHGMDKLESEH